MSEKSRKLKRSSRFNSAVVMPFVAVFNKPVMKYMGVQVEKYKPKNKEFVVISNHTDAIDPGYVMVALGRYIRFIASDHVARAPFGGWIVRNLGGVIVKHREKDSQVLIDEIVENARAGVPVAIFAEGGTSFNGETRFISMRTAQMVKDCGTALITFRFVGGYLRWPKWAAHMRKGPTFGKVVNEYSAEEIAKMSVEELYEIIKRDTYVNAYDEQRKNPHEYKGENLAEYLEYIIYMCPECKQVGTLHSKGDYCKCSACGYGIKCESDGFFHGIDGKDAIFDNTCDWDKWQRKNWQERVLSAADGELIYEDKNQKIAILENNEKTVITDNGTLQLYKDKFVVSYGTERYEMPINKLHSVQTVSQSAVILIDDNNYFEIRSASPRSATMYVAAWRYLIGKEYF